MLTRKLAASTLAAALVLLNACGFRPGSPQPLDAIQAPAAEAAMAQAYNQLPLYFIENLGQADPQVAFYVPGRDQMLYFTADGLTLAFTYSAETGQAEASLAGPLVGMPAVTQRWVVKQDFVGANPDVQPLGQQETGATFSYFKGKPEQWRAGLHAYGQVRYPNLWPGIDLVYSGQVNRLKYEFVVQPGADPAQIRLAYRGASQVALTAEGQLEVTSPLGSFRDETPVAYQMKDGQRVPVEMRYALDPAAASGEADRHEYGFQLGAYDPALPLVLDPAVVVYAGYIGGSGGDYGRGIAVDEQGFAYVTGVTISGESTFPVTVGPDLTYNGGAYDIFAAKVNPTGTALIYAGYIGGSRSEGGDAIAIDPAGNAYITGYTYSPEATFPITVGPDLVFNGGPIDFDAFVLKLNAAGTALDYAGYIGGIAGEAGRGIAVDSAGSAYVTGFTGSGQNTFPDTVGPDLFYNSGLDAFVAKVNPAGTALDYAGYIGGGADDSGSGITVDAAGSVFVVGDTSSDEGSFPEILGPDLSYNGGGDGFVASVNISGTELVFAGYIGGAGHETGAGISVDAGGNIYLTGQTNSDEVTFPVSVGPDLTYNGGSQDAYVAKVSAGGGSLMYAGYVGGVGQDTGYAIDVDAQGNAYITGLTVSSETTFPVAGGPDLTFADGGGDGYVAKINPTGSGLDYAGYIGGTGYDQGNAITVDNFGNVYITGQTVSEASSFPVRNGPDLVANGASDAFVALVSSGHIWTGAIDTNWNEVGNWKPIGVPAAGDGMDCLVPAGLANYPAVSSTTLGCDGSLTIAAGAQLSTDTATYNAGESVELDGVWFASNSLDFLGENTALNVNGPGRLVLDNASIGNFGVISTTVNAVSVTGTVQISGTSAVYHGTSLVVNPAGKVTLPLSSTLEVRDSGTLTNTGFMEQEKLVIGPTEFLHITDGAATDKYFGVVITPTADDLLTTTVSIEGFRPCTVGTVARCYTITPGVVATATVAFYYSEAEANGNTAPNAYHWSGSSWDVLTSTVGGSGLGFYVVADGVTGYGLFALADSLPLGVPFMDLYLPLVIWR